LLQCDQPALPTKSSRRLRAPPAAGKRKPNGGDRGPSYSSRARIAAGRNQPFSGATLIADGRPRATPASRSRTAPAYGDVGWPFSLGRAVLAPPRSPTYGLPNRSATLVRRRSPRCARSSPTSSTSDNPSDNRSSRARRWRQSAHHETTDRQHLGSSRSALVGRCHWSDPIRPEPLTSAITSRVHEAGNESACRVLRR
jgi:hypothetical protein